MSGCPEMPPWAEARAREITDEMTAAAPLSGTVEGEFIDAPQRAMLEVGVSESQAIPHFTGFLDDLVGKKGYGLNSCPARCPYQGDNHAHLSLPGDGLPFIAWADGRFSGYDLTLPAKLVYAPVPIRAAGIRAYDVVLPEWPGPSDAWSPFRDRIPRASRCYRADAGFAVHVKPDCRCPR